MRHFACVFLTVASLVGCNSTPKPPQKPPVVQTMRVVHQVGGTHYRTVVHGEIWYQTFGRQLLVLATDNLTPVKTIELGKQGEIGGAIDLAIDSKGERLYIVIDGDEVIEFSLETPQSPEIIRRIAAAEIGIMPRRLTRLDGEMYVSGVGGVVRLNDGVRVFSSEEDVSRIARTETGLVGCIGRRAFRLDDGRYIGSASEIQALDDSQGTLAFARQGEQGVLVGLMSPDVRELDPQKSTVAAPGLLRSVRVFDDRLWIVTDRTISGYLIQEQAMRDPIHIDVLGGFDIAPLGTNHLAIAGTFGRMIYRLPTDEKEAGFVQVHREPSSLSQAVTDGRHILAGGNEGLWMYLINSRAELTTRQFERVPLPPSQSATVTTAQAKISEDGRSITITHHAQGDGLAVEPFVYAEKNCLLRCVVAVDGEFWVGHDRGITIIKPNPPMLARGKTEIDPNLNRIAARLRIDGPVRYIFPLLVGGGASFVSEYGGFGVIQSVEEPVAANR